jgi:transposase InsO family protein
MSLDNPFWGAPRVHGELLKLGIEVSQATVGRYLPRRPKTPSPTWRSFLRNHMTVIVAVDMFVVATATFRMLYAVIVLDHHRRRVIHFEVTRNPTQVWLARQITEAFPWDTAPRYLLRDRDTSYGLCFQNRVRAMGIQEVLTAPRSPWQSPSVERIIGSIRRECLDQRNAFSIPKQVPFDEASALIVTYGTSYYALKNCANLLPGETLIVVGAAGGVGLAAVELGRALKARVIAAASSEEKVALAKEHGADGVSSIPGDHSISRNWASCRHFSSKRAQTVPPSSMME